MRGSLLGFILVRDDDDPFLKVGPTGRDEDAPILYPPVRPVAKTRDTPCYEQTPESSGSLAYYWVWTRFDRGRAA